MFVFSAAAQKPVHTDLVIINANIRTMTSSASRAEAVAVSGNRITAVGTTKEISRRIGPTTNVIDARGRLVLPGFNDAHVHFMGVGNSFSTLDLRLVSSTEQMLARIREYSRVLPPGRWILGSGWDETRFKLPSIASVDDLTRENPLLLYSSDGSKAFVNSLALTNANQKSSSNGIIAGPSLDRVRIAAPTGHTRNWLQLAETATNHAAMLGVTTVQDMHSDHSRDIYLELQRQGKLKTRIYDCVPLPDWKKLAGARLDNGMVRTGCLKSFADNDDTSFDRLLKDVVPADKAGLQVMIHAIGNSPNDMALRVFESVVRTNGRRDRRLRVEHAHNPRTTDLPRFARLGVIASVQPHLFDGSAGGYYASMSDQKIMLALGSDAAMTSLNPLLGIQAAVGAGDHALSVYDAVRSYTYGSAYAEFQEKEKGTIEPGKLADFVILSDDIFSIDRDKISGVTVITTIVDGRVVYQSK